MEQDQQIEEQDQDAAVSEQLTGDAQEGQEEQQDGQKMVPLSAMLATRKKLQDAEMRAAKAEAASQVYQQHLNNLGNGAKEEEEEDPQGIVEKKDLREHTAHTKRDILETLYQDMNPEAVQKINKYLKPILEKSLG